MSDAELLRPDLLNELLESLAPYTDDLDFGRQFDFNWERGEGLGPNLQFTTVNHLEQDPALMSEETIFENDRNRILTCIKNRFSDFSVTEIPLNWVAVTDLPALNVASPTNTHVHNYAAGAASNDGKVRPDR